MRVLGMISGTSHDGIDYALVDFVQRDSELTGTLMAQGSRPYSSRLRRRLMDILPPASTTVEEICRVDHLIGEEFAATAADVLAGQETDLICSHGQTVFHLVEGGRAKATMQIGQPALIRRATGVPVLADLRQGDLADGGQGAPLVPILDLLLLGHLPGRTIALNLGGIANITVLGDGEPMAYDVGPANALIDAAMVLTTHGAQAFDRDGLVAASGRVDDRLLAELLSEPYYGATAPKSTGKELFNSRYVEMALQRHELAPEDLIATLTALTARIVADAVTRHSGHRVVASGGGADNPTLMGMMRRSLPEVEVVTTDAYGAPRATKEAIAFALIGYLSANGLPGNVPSCTGAAGPVVLGTMSLPGPTVVNDAVMPRQLVLQ